MTKIVKVDCDKWLDRLFILARCGLIALWGLASLGLSYGSYLFFNNLAQHNYESCNDRFSNNIYCWPGSVAYDGIIIFGIFIIFNIVNYYVIARTVYRNQNIIKFECSSGGQQ